MMAASSIMHWFGVPVVRITGLNSKYISGLRIKPSMLLIETQDHLLHCVIKEVSKMI